MQAKACDAYLDHASNRRMMHRHWEKYWPSQHLMGQLHATIVASPYQGRLLQSWWKTAPKPCSISNARVWFLPNRTMHMSHATGCDSNCMQHPEQMDSNCMQYFCSRQLKRHLNRLASKAWVTRVCHECLILFSYTSRCKIMIVGQTKGSRCKNYPR